jgi:hypothetical protein
VLSLGQQWVITRRIEAQGSSQPVKTKKLDKKQDNKED